MKVRTARPGPRVVERGLGELPKGHDGYRRRLDKKCVVGL